MIKYKNGNYNVYLFNDGTKIRYTQDDELIPDRAESIDLTITERCKMQCNFCYANCTPSGKHANLFDINGNPVYWLSTVKPYTELAINGNDLDHPELLQFLTYCKKHKIIVNITVHQQQYINNYDKISEYKKDKLINGIGVSISNPDDNLISLIKNMNDVVCHLIAGIVTDNILSSLANNNLKVLILGYKNIGRGISYNAKYSKDVEDNINWLSDNIMSISDGFNAVSFDCLACEQLHMKDKLTATQWNNLYMGEDGTTTFYINAVNNTYAKSSTETKFKQMLNNSIDEMFKSIIK